eukprot:1902725-Ditylum_brightwellii.AAC.1
MQLMGIIVLVQPMTESFCSTITKKSSTPSLAKASRLPWRRNTVIILKTKSTMSLINLTPCPSPQATEIMSATPQREVMTQMMTSPCIVTT